MCCYQDEKHSIVVTALSGAQPPAAPAAGRPDEGADDMTQRYEDEIGPWFVVVPDAPNTSRRMSVADIERLLERDEDVTITILPNGEIRDLTAEERAAIPRKPLTMRENLGGEYAAW